MGWYVASLKNRKGTVAGLTVVFLYFLQRCWTISPGMKPVGREILLFVLRQRGVSWYSNMKASGNRWILYATRTTLKNNGKAEWRHGRYGDSRFILGGEKGFSHWPY